MTSVRAGGSGFWGFWRALALNDTQLIWAGSPEAQRTCSEGGSGTCPACLHTTWRLWLSGRGAGGGSGPLGGVSAPKYNPAALRRGPSQSWAESVSWGSELCQCSG